MKNINENTINNIPASDLYYEKEKFCDTLFTIEQRMNKAKKEETKRNLFDEFMKGIEILKIYESRINKVFG